MQEQPGQESTGQPCVAAGRLALAALSRRWPVVVVVVVYVVAPRGSCRWPMALGPRDSGLCSHSGQVVIAQITVRGGKYNIPGLGPSTRSSMQPQSPQMARAPWTLRAEG